MENKQYRIGIDLGGTNIKAGVVNASNEIVATARRKTLVNRPWQEIVADMAAAAREAVQQAGITLEDCASLGVGSPGTVNAKTGIVVYSNNFPGWENIPLGETLGKDLGLPVYLSNDANCAALGEFVAGAAKNADSTVLLTLGTGVGGGVVFDGKVFEGGPGGAELGHTTLVVDGILCTCGRKGCIESYCSATALIREAKAAALRHPDSKLAAMCEGNVENMDGRIPFEAARAGDNTAQQVVEEYIHMLGEGIVNMVNIFRPEIVLLSGGICGEGRYLTDPLNAFVRTHAFAGERIAIPPVERAMLGNDAGIIGAANLR